MKARLILAALLTLSLAPEARGDTVSDALDAVETFAAEVGELTKGLPDRAGADAFQKLSTGRSKKTLSEIKAMRWAEEPGSRRSRHLLESVESYTAEEIDSIKALGGSGADKVRLDEIIKTLTTLRERSLKELRESYGSVTFPAKRRKAVPSVDTSPYEEGPDRGKGIWDR
ncbi:MAG: hypothetical protein V3W31_03310 [Thermodesulfobacteriota bacterium]